MAESSRSSIEGRWWEYYAIRYFTGTAIGAGIVVFLNSADGSSLRGILAPVLKDATEVGLGGLSLIGALGFAYCYVASAPMLTLHSARVHLRSVRLQWFALLCFTVLVGLGTAVAGRFGTITDVTVMRGFAWLSLSFVLGLQVSLLYRTHRDKEALVLFYKRLTLKRAGKGSEDGPTTEYVTSYRHLREHGNAFAIVVCEGALALVLYSLPRELSPLILVGWVLPSVSSWFIGTLLERRFVDDSSGA